LLWWNSSPNDGQLYIYYNDGTSSQWVTANNFTGGSNNLFLPLSGGALTGPLTLAADATAPFGAATKRTVDAALNDVGRNQLLNGLFNIQQRGQGPWGGNIYMVDRWYVFTVNDTINATLVALSDIDRAAIGDEAAVSALQFVFTGSATAGSYSGFNQKTENVRRLSNKTVTWSFYARATSGTPRLTCDYYQYFGTGGSPSASVSGNVGITPALSSTWQRYTMTTTLPSISGKTLGTNSDNSTIFQTELSVQGSSIGVQSGTVQVWGMQVEVGSIASPLEKPDPQIDLAKCQRFYQPYGQVLCSGYNVGASGVFIDFPFPVPFRATPSAAFTNITYSNGSGLAVNLLTSNHARFSVIATVTGLSYATFDLALIAEL
jgi:hypothetical protein